MGRNGLTRKQLLAEKNAEMRRQQQKKKEQKTEEAIVGPLTQSQIETIDQQIRDVEKRFRLSQTETDRYVEIHTVGGDVELRIEVRRGGAPYFAGQNSTELNRVLRQKLGRTKRLRSQLENLQDRRDPGRHERMKREVEQSQRHQQLVMHSFGLGPMPPPKEHPKDVIIVERKSVGLMIGDDGKGNPAYLRCYHERWDECLPCDCHHDKEGNIFTLSEKSQALLESGLLEIDNEIFELQRRDLQMMGDGVINRWAGIGESLAGFLQKKSSEGSEGSDMESKSESDE